MRAWVTTATLLLCGPAFGQQPAGQGGQQGVEVDVTAGGFTLFLLAIPDALNLGEVPDTRGVGEALSGTINRDLKIAAYFQILKKTAYLIDPKQEGMTPNFRAWFNTGTQGLIKSGYTIEGREVTVDLRLYTIDGTRQIDLPAPYDKPAKLPLEPRKLRRHAHGFANLVVKHFTGAEGFFLSRIVFVKRVGRGKELFTISPDGNDEAGITHNKSINMLPSVAGGRIYFTSFLAGSPQLYVKRGGKTERFTNYRGLNTGATLSPGGKYVAATLSKDGNPEIYLLHPDSGAVIKRLTNSWGIDTSPSWSPDGKQIAFVSDRHGSPQIWVMSSSGGGARRLTFQGDYNQTPDWSPRGDKILFTARDERFKFDIFTVDVATGDIQRLTQQQGNNEEPSWSPNGRYITFTSTRTGDSKLYIMTADGAIQNQISKGKGEYLTPWWER